MADSNITKKALANALKELMEEIPFSKISVGDICNKCDMNRKSFYYHFKDKYDLVNWIFDTEFISLFNKMESPRGWDWLRELCQYLYDERDFYRRALKIDGQNSFSSHFLETLSAITAVELGQIFTNDELEVFHVHFVADGFVCALERWILNKDCISADEFIAQIQSTIALMATKVKIRSLGDTPSESI